MLSERQFTDTTDFYSINQGDEIVIGCKRYRVTGNEKERRFGVEDPKFWVKRAIDIDTEEKKIIKLSFLESFNTTLAGATIRCFRDPDKEGAILNLVKDHPDFMQGETFWDTENNNIRVLDIIRGTNFFVHIGNFSRMDHEIYFQRELPAILHKLVDAFEAIRFLHIKGFRHGDIRNDHLMIERATGNYVWIDFDYDYIAYENPYSLDLFGIGNILMYAVGKGFHNLYMIKNDSYTYGDLYNHVEEGDMSLLDPSRFVNLKKMYPYIPRMLNDIIMHFSKGAYLYYETVGEILIDLKGYLRSL